MEDKYENDSTGVGVNSSQTSVNVGNDTVISKPKRLFMLTGFHGKEKDKLHLVIQALKASLFDDTINVKVCFYCFA